MAGKKGINRGINPARKKKEEENKAPEWKFNEQQVDFLKIVMSQQKKLHLPLTGEKDLFFSSSGLTDKIVNTTANTKYVEAFNLYVESLTKNGLMAAVKKDDTIIAYIPDWDLFITALTVYMIMYRAVDGV